MKRRLNKILLNIKNHGLLYTIAWLFKCLWFYIKKPFLKKNRVIDYKSLDIYKDTYLYKNNKNVYIFSGIPYYDIGCGQRASQLAKTFNILGFKVYFIYGNNSTSKVFNNIDIPCVMHINIDDLNESDINFNKDDIVIFEMPLDKFSKYLDKAYNSKAFIIYENIDNWNTSLGNDMVSNKMLTSLLKYSNILTATSKLLVKQTNNYLKKLHINKDVIYLPNAVDDNIFKGLGNYEKPSDFIKGNKTVLYYGSLYGSWFDWDLIKKVALKSLDISFLLIGNYESVKDKIKTLPKNIHFLGEKKQSDLPAYLYYADYAMIPFKPGEITDYVSPIKIFEYISMYKPILTTNMPDIKGYPNILSSDNYKDWIKALNKNKSVNKEECDKFIINNNWSSRVEVLLDLYGYNVSVNSNISIIILNHNNGDVIFKCIDSLINYRKRYNYEIIIVDNDSTDDSYNEIIKKYKDIEYIKIIKNAKNGCSSGRNLGVKNARYEYLLFLDSDQWVNNSYFLDNYISIIYSDKKIGAVGWTGGWFNSKGQAFGSVEGLKDVYNNPIIIADSDIGYLGSGGLLVSKKLFNLIEGFDEKYDPTCYEDTDFSLKIKNKGYRIVYSKYSGICHLGHATTKIKTKEYDVLFKRNSKYFKNKWKQIDYSLIKNHQKKKKEFKKIW